MVSTVSNSYSVFSVSTRIEWRTRIAVAVQCNDGKNRAPRPCLLLVDNNSRSAPVSRAVPGARGHSTGFDSALGFQHSNDVVPGPFNYT